MIRTGGGTSERWFSLTLPRACMLWLLNCCCYCTCLVCLSKIVVDAAIGAFFAPFVTLLMVLMLPIGWPLAKLLDLILGQCTLLHHHILHSTSCTQLLALNSLHSTPCFDRFGTGEHHSAFFRRAELGVLVNIHTMVRTLFVNASVTQCCLSSSPHPSDAQAHLFHLCHVHARACVCLCICVYLCACICVSVCLLLYATAA